MFTVKKLKISGFKSFAHPTEILIEDGVTGIIGPNGCGKTTTIGMMLGLIKPSSGMIKIDDQDINRVERVKILEKVNFASPYIELPKRLTVRQNLGYLANCTVSKIWKKELLKLLKI